MSHHILRHRELMIDLAIVHLELEAHEVGQDGRGARMRLDGWSGGLTRLRPYYWET